MTQDDAFDHNAKQKPQVYIKWRDTDVAAEFYCDCGAHNGLDGTGSHCVQCYRCKTVWEMPSVLFPRKADDRALKLHRENPKVMSDNGDTVDAGRR